jgi:phosphoribosylformimino-5-aminoimidazole carboxamide ribotide isomerase
VIAAPAVDLRGGRCVQLVGGLPEAEAVSLSDPVAVAERWWQAGFATLHLVDLDAAFGSGENVALLEELLGATNAETQIGGGIRDDDRADSLISAGADRIIVGTRALEDRAWLSRLAIRHPERVMVALDTRGGIVLRKGWRETTGIELGTLLKELADLPLAGILSTDVSREGRLEGIDREVAERTISTSSHPMWISGGVTTFDELTHLDALGAAGAVLGMALYTNTLDADEVAQRWGSTQTR